MNPTGAPETVKVAIVDDEPLCRDVLRHYLTAKPEVRIVGECPNGPAAVKLLKRCSADVLFLDVQMPGMDGFALLEALESAPPPVVVLVTAHDQYALQAFEAEALDYLLKPFDQRRFDHMWERVCTQLGRVRASELHQKLAAVFSKAQVRNQETAVPPEPRTCASRLMVRDAGRIRIVNTGDVLWMEAEGDYVRLHLASERHLLHETMQNLEATLDRKQFVRIHRSTIVNVEAIRELQPHTNGEYWVLLKNGARLKLSRNYRESLQSMFGQFTANPL